MERAGALKVLWFENVVEASGLDALSFFALFPAQVKILSPQGTQCSTESVGLVCATADSSCLVSLGRGNRKLP